MCVGGHINQIGLYNNVSGQARDFDDPPGLVEKTEYLLREWISIHYSATAGRDPTRAFSIFVQQVRPNAVSKSCAIQKYRNFLFVHTSYVVHSGSVSVANA